MRPDDEEIVGKTVEWAMNHVQREVNFEGVEALLIGDSVALTARPIEVPEEGVYGWIDLGTTQALWLRGPQGTGSGDGPYVWVVGSDDGPLVEVAIVRTVSAAPFQTKEAVAGRLRLPSGCLTIASPTAVSLWGNAIVRAGEGRAIEFLQSEDVDGPYRDGWALLLRLDHVTECGVHLSELDRGEVIGMSLKLPLPAWLPRQRSILE